MNTMHNRRATPKTLWEQINYQNKLLKQLTFEGADNRKVVLNKSGQIIRAGRTSIDMLLEAPGIIAFCLIPTLRSSSRSCLPRQSRESISICILFAKSRSIQPILTTSN